MLFGGAYDAAANGADGRCAVNANKNTACFSAAEPMAVSKRSFRSFPARRNLFEKWRRRGCFDAPGGVPDSAANALIAAGHALNGLEIICEDGSRLLLSHKNYEKLVRAGARFTVMNKTRLLAVTVNPFSSKGSHYNKTEFYRCHVQRSRRTRCGA